MRVCARQTFLIGSKEKPSGSAFVVNKPSKVNFLSEANLRFIASRLNNSTITITFVVIYKLCASEQRGSVCVGVGASRCVHVCVYGRGRCLFHWGFVCFAAVL